MANTVTAANFANVPGGVASRSGRIDLGTITGDTAIAAPTLITDGFAFFQLDNAYVAIDVTAGTITVDLWAGYLPNDGLPGAIRWVKVAAAAQLAGITGPREWILPSTVGRPDRLGVELSIGVAPAAFKILISGGKPLA